MGLEMRQDMSEQIWYQQLPRQFVHYLARPFKITKVLELLYVLNWLWIALLTLFVPNLPFSRSSSIVLVYPYATILWLFIAGFSSYGVWHNIIIIRRITLIFNILITTFLFTKNLVSAPLTAASGYLFILIGLTIFAYWRMDLAE